MYYNNIDLIIDQKLMESKFELYEYNSLMKFFNFSLNEKIINK
jgi:hypothetical protein